MSTDSTTLQHSELFGVDLQQLIQMWRVSVRSALPKAKAIVSLFFFQLRGQTPAHPAETLENQSHGILCNNSQKYKVKALEARCISVGSLFSTTI